ncbi:MerR family transcriptional regulator [Enterococcus florum]|uniref:MerR family transcriptional regulator n=1 Tax=Enterococcus florum TaxID=2480627 RepID=A0A4P5PCA6_9ENTE|nr:MerR family transcriptional regulator [Enterococcus florum]GCF95720.1 MerR family transcriptional regulator [Enterococcus florum]
MLKIGEFSKLAHVSIRMLRHYDEIGLLHPKKIDDESGYRYYEAHQLEQLERILMLKELTFSLKEIKRILTEGPEDFKRELIEKSKEIQTEIEKDQQRLEMIERRILQIDLPREYCIEVKTVPAFFGVSLRGTIPTFYHEGSMWETFHALLAKQEIQISPQVPNNATIFHDQKYEEGSIDIEVVYAIEHLISVQQPLQVREFPELPLVGSIQVEGNYHQLPEAYHAFASWLENHPEYEMSTTTRQVSFVGPEETEDPEDYFTEIQIPLKSVVDPHTTSGIIL